MWSLDSHSCYTRIKYMLKINPVESTHVGACPTHVKSNYAFQLWILFKHKR
jgi:hypothetical protein